MDKPSEVSAAETPVSDALGNNDLINQLLTQRISETPTKLVPEVDPPEVIEIKEAKQVEKKKQVAPKEEKPIDYTEYEKEPVPIEISEEGTAITTTEDEALDEQKIRRRELTAKWVIRLYDKFQGLGSMFLYDKINTHQDLLEQRNFLMNKVYDQSIEEEETAILKQLNERLATIADRRNEFNTQVHLSEDLKVDAEELLFDMIKVSKKEINPMWVLAFMLIIPLLSNLITAFTHHTQFKPSNHGI